MWIRTTIGVLVNGEHLDPMRAYEVEERIGRPLIASGRAHEVVAPPPAPTPAEVIETREPVVATREPKVRRRP